MVQVRLKVNGKEYELDVKPNERLIDTLRWRLGLVSVKEGCSQGECGACTVLVNGKPVRSCITLTATLDGAEITTLEGLAPENKVHAIQLAFLEAGGVQCGFCTPGFIMTVKALLDHNPTPSDEEILEWLGNVLCRCGSYHRYIDAVKLAIKYIREGKVFFDLKEVRSKYYMRVVG
ncbi:MAG: (2Fe-2S)-binding protein [Thermoprotei archaeon]